MSAFWVKFAPIRLIAAFSFVNVLIVKVTWKISSQASSMCVPVPNSLLDNG